jgi:hypothetical protein
LTLCKLNTALTVMVLDIAISLCTRSQTHHKQVYVTSRADAFYELEREQGVNKTGHKHVVAVSFTNQDT